MYPIERMMTGLAALALLGSSGCVSPSPGDGPRDLLEEGLDGWGCHLSEPGATQSDVWAFVDGVLICAGNPLGYLYTRESYADFTLELEWRWPPGKDPGKGGVLIRTTGEHKIWPRSLEAQLNAGDAGDFWGLDGYPLSGPPDRTTSVQNERFGLLTNLKKLEALERPAGEWNRYEIIAKGDTVTLRINGETVNQATGCATEPGKICLTAEGSEIHFRGVRLSDV